MPDTTGTIFIVCGMFTVLERVPRKFSFTCVFDVVCAVWCCGGGVLLWGNGGSVIGVLFST